MTVKELRELLAGIPDDFEVCYEYDGPDTFTEVNADGLTIYGDRIVLSERRNLLVTTIRKDVN